MKRDANIDFRGIAVLAVLFIHTVCKSGSEYIPIWMLDVALIVDVPLFILSLFYYLEEIILI